MMFRSIHGVLCLLFVSSTPALAQTDSTATNKVQTEPFKKVYDSIDLNIKSPENYDLVVYYGPEEISGRIMGTIEVRGKSARLVNWGDDSRNSVDLEYRREKTGRIVINFKKGQLITLLPKSDCNECLPWSVEYDYHFGKIKHEEQNLAVARQANATPQFLFEKYKDTFVGLKGLTLKNCDVLKKRCDEIQKACTDFVLAETEIVSAWPEKKLKLEAELESLLIANQKMESDFREIDLRAARLKVEWLAAESDVADARRKVEGKQATVEANAPVTPVRIEAIEKSIANYKGNLERSAKIISDTEKYLAKNRFLKFIKFRANNRLKKERSRNGKRKLKK
jgi:hypothetical protein